MNFSAIGQNQEFIVQINTENDISAFIRHFNNENKGEFFLTYKELLSKGMSIHLIENQIYKSDEAVIRQLMAYYPIVLAVQTNKKLSYRNNTFPDDTLFKNQWSLYNDGSNGGLAGADINILPLWSINTGGLTCQGDTIVVAVIDDGIDTTHIDLKPNLWLNFNEIRGNNIDDDSNGYIDDYQGWNTYSNNDNILYDGSHGTQVSGIIGAKGNNTSGISGINWNIKTMMIVGGGYESDAIKAYSYIMTMRELYNKTKGLKGAFVVSTNTSWGLDFKFPKDAPIWCALYDSLGKQGILSVAATTNNDVPVDSFGDLPTTCPSNYLLTVNATNKLDQRIFSGYGKKSIDMGAPGKNVYTTANTNGISPNYSYFTGTSASSPHAAGVASLLYATACNGLIELGRKYPDSLAFLIKLFMMQGVKPLGALYNYTATGGRLNAYGAYLKMMDYCNNILNVENIASVYDLIAFPNPVTNEISLNINLENAEIQIIDFAGKTYKLCKTTNNTLDLSGFLSGFYILKISIESRSYFTKILKI